MGGKRKGLSVICIKVTVKRKGRDKYTEKGQCTYEE